MARAEQPSRWIIGWAATGAVLVLGGPALVADEPREVSAASALGATQDEPDEPDDVRIDVDDLDLQELDLEDLMQIQVTSVAGRAQALLDTPAAVTVLSGEDVRRSGLRSIPEILRLVPGFDIGRISPSIWAIGSRGFPDRFANDLLVLIDGRTVYDPLFSGVFWNVQDVLLEDLDRIEVVRGPGATLWGANAVNGVVNITTRSAKDTQGVYVTGGGGNLDRGFAAFRYGDSIDDELFFRIYGKYDNYDSFPQITGGDSHSAWDMFRGGFRMDWGRAEEVEMTLQGDIYATGRSDEAVRVPVPGAHLTFANVDLEGQFNGGNVLFRAGARRGEGWGWSFQTYYDRTKTRGGQPGFEVRRDTFDVDYRQYATLGEAGRHVLNWGLGYRFTGDRTEIGPTLSFDPRTRSLNTFSGFVQDTIALVPDRLSFMVGSKFEHNDVSGFEFQPSGRLSWTPDRNQIVWGAVSRAVRTPSRTADDVRLTTGFADTGLLAGGPPSGVFVPLVLEGDPDVDSEQLIAYEAGYRVRLNDAITLDLAGFYNDYDDLITFPAGAGTFGNRGKAQTYGGEISGTWSVADGWRLSASYSYLEVNVDSIDGNQAEHDAPQQQFQLHSYLDLGDDLELNSGLYYVDRVPASNANAYLRLDVGVTWRPSPNVELAVWGQNLLDSRHLEFTDDLFQAVPLEVERSFYAQLTIRF